MFVMQFTELKQHLHAQQPLPAYLIVGEDAFLRKSAADMFKALVTDMPELNLSVLNAPDTPDEILQAAESLPLISPLRVVLVYDYKGDMAKVLRYLENPCPTSVLVFVLPSLTSAFSKAAAKLMPVECERLSPALLGRWIAASAAEKGCAVTQEAADTLIAYCDRNLTRIAGELEKLCAYRMNGTVSAQDVRDLVTADAEVKIYELSDALGRKQSARVASVLTSLLQDGTPVVSLMGMLYAHFRRLLYCSITPPSAEMAADLGVKEFAVKKAKEQAAKFSPKRLKKICDSFHKADADFKSGKITDRNALDLFILETLHA